MANIEVIDDVKWTMLMEEFRFLWDPLDPNFSTRRPQDYERFQAKYNSLASASEDMESLKIRLAAIHKLKKGYIPKSACMECLQKSKDIATLLPAFPCFWDSHDLNFTDEAVKARCLEQLLERYNNLNVTRISMEELKQKLSIFQVNRIQCCLTDTHNISGAPPIQTPPIQTPPIQATVKVMGGDLETHTENAEIPITHKRYMSKDDWIKLLTEFPSLSDQDHVNFRSRNKTRLQNQLLAKYNAMSIIPLTMRDLKRKMKSWFQLKRRKRASSTKTPPIQAVEVTGGDLEIPHTENAEILITDKQYMLRNDWVKLMQEYPCLWDPADINFMDNKIKTRCRHQLLAKYNHMSPIPITKEELRTKIRTWKQMKRRERIAIFRDTQSQAQLEIEADPEIPHTENAEIPVTNKYCKLKNDWVRLLREYPCLWDPGDFNFRDATFKSLCRNRLLARYNHISSLPITMEELKTKIRTWNQMKHRERIAIALDSQSQARLEIESDREIPQTQNVEIPIAGKCYISKDDWVKLLEEYPILKVPDDLSYCHYWMKHRCMNQLLEKYNDMSIIPITINELKTNIEISRQEKRCERSLILHSIRCVSTKPGPSLGSQPAPGPSLGSKPAPGLSLGSQPAPGPSPGSKPAPGPSLGSHRAPGPPLGTHPAPGPSPGSKPAPGASPGTKPAPGPSLGSQPAPGASPGSKPAPGPSLGSKPAPGPSLGSQPAPGASHCSKPAPGPSLGSQPAPGASHCSKPAPGPSLGSKPAPGPSHGSKPAPGPSPSSQSAVPPAGQRPTVLYTDEHEDEPMVDIHFHDYTPKKAPSSEQLQKKCAGSSILVDMAELRRKFNLVAPQRNKKIIKKPGQKPSERMAELLKEFPCLWDPDDLNYRDVTLKARARKQLLEKYNAISSFPIDIKRLRKKIKAVKQWQSRNKKINKKPGPKPSERMAELLKEFPCLWDPRDMNFHCQIEKAQARERFLQKYNAISSIPIDINELKRKLKAVCIQRNRLQKGGKSLVKATQDAEAAEAFSNEGELYSVDDYAHRLEVAYGQETETASQPRETPSCTLAEFARSIYSTDSQDIFDSIEVDRSISDTSEAEEPQEPIHQPPRCSFCGTPDENCLNINNDTPYVAENAITLTLNSLCLNLDFNTSPKTVCRNCDTKLKEINDFLSLVKNAQDNLTNVEALDTKIEVKDEEPICVYDDYDVDGVIDDENDCKDVYDTITVTDTEFLKQTVNTYLDKTEVIPEKRKRCSVYIDLKCPLTSVDYLDNDNINNEAQPEQHVTESDVVKETIFVDQNTGVTIDFFKPVIENNKRGNSGKFIDIQARCKETRNNSSNRHRKKAKLSNVRTHTPKGAQL